MSGIRVMNEHNRKLAEAMPKWSYTGGVPRVSTDLTKAAASACVAEPTGETVYVDMGGERTEVKLIERYPDGDVRAQYFGRTIIAREVL